MVGGLHALGLTMAGAGGGFRLLALVWGAVYGAVAGGLVASSILQGIEKAGAEGEGAAPG